MSDTSKSIIAKKSHQFAILIIELYKSLHNKNEFVIAKQILRSGTSIGANIHEALSTETIRDFVYKLSISKKEANETLYWLQLLYDTDYISESIFTQLKDQCIALKKILSSIILTTKQRYF